MTGAIVRKMETGDLEAVWQLEQACFSEPWSLKIIKDASANSFDYFFVAEDMGRVCGYANLRVLAGEGEIERIAVSPDKRGEGVGKKLMEEMARTARELDAGDLSLEVRAGNEAAINLYKSYGFRQEAVRKSYYRNPTEDAIIMWRRSHERFTT